MSRKIVEGEKVLCYHGTLIYEAKCLKIRKSEDEPDKLEHFIHYAGWNKKWEEWVGESRILKYTEENIKKQKLLQEQEIEMKAKLKGMPGRKSSITEKDIKEKESISRPCSPAVSVKSNKSNHDSTKEDIDVTEPPKPTRGRKSNAVKEKERENEKQSKAKDREKEKETSKEIKENVRPEEETAQLAEPKYRLRVVLPDVLSRLVTNDTHFIQEQQFLTSVPAELTCKQLFDDFLQSKGPDKALEIQWSGLTEFIKGLQQYIDEMLGVRLLYRFEKLQYKQVKEKYHDTPLHTLYCPILVLRLICNLERVLTPQMALTPKGLKLIEEHMKDFIKFLENNHEKYFGSFLYDAATPEYLRMTFK